MKLLTFHIQGCSMASLRDCSSWLRRQVSKQAEVELFQTTIPKLHKPLPGNSCHIFYTIKL